MELRVQLAEALAEAAESRSEIRFKQVAHDAEITRLLNEAKFQEHNTALEQMAKFAQTAALTQKEQAGEFARKGTMDVEIKGLAKQIEDLKLSREHRTGQGKGSEDLKRIGMMIVGAVVVGAVALVFSALKNGAAG